MALVGLLVAGIFLQPLGAGAEAEQAQGDEAGDEGGGRVLMLSVPGLTWADVADHDLPVLEGFLEDAAIANHAPRGVSGTSPPGAAYLTISAGARASGKPSDDGQILALEDRAAGSAAGEIFDVRTGFSPDGDYVVLEWPSLLKGNAAEPYDAELGLLTETLAEEGLGAAAIANADGTDTVADSYERQAGLAVVTPDGVVPSGDLDVDLLVTDTKRPFGSRLDEDRVVERFEEQWPAPGGQPGGLVVVEASDLARTMRYRDRVDTERYDELWAQSLADADELVGRLLAEVDPERDSVLLLAPYNQPGNRDLTVAALQTPDSQGSGGYLRSASTQRSGFVTLVDIAPTVLDLLGVDRPTAMEGRPFEVVANSTSLDDRVDRMVSANAASRFREQLLVPTTLVIVVAFALVGALAIVALARPRGPEGSVRALVTGGALFTVALMPLSYLARAFPLEDYGLGFYWAFILTGAALVAAVATLLGRGLRRPRLPLAAVLVFTVAVPAFDVMTGSNLSLSAPFGYSPTGNSRLYGISNYALGAFCASLSLLAAMVASRGVPPGIGLRGGGTSEKSSSPSGWNQFAAMAVMLAGLAVIGVPVWGANVGGILSFSPVVVLFAAVLWGSRVRLRTMIVGFAVAMAAAISLFAALDLARPPSQRAHLGRLVERISDDGLGPLFSIMERKAVAALEVTLTSFWTAGVLVAVVVWLVLRRLPERPLERVRDRVPLINAGLAAGVLAAVFGSIMNDSGSIVGGTAMLVVVVALICLALEPVSAGVLGTDGGTDALAAEFDGDGAARLPSSDAEPDRRDKDSLDRAGEGTEAREASDAGQVESPA